MFGPGSTAGKIDEYESRFTTVNGAHFLIAANGEEAYPISATESREFRDLYRRRMTRAGRIRRLAVLGPFFLLLFLMLTESLPSWLRPVRQAAGLLVMAALPLGLIQHPVTSDLARMSIERRLKRRITTRFPAAVTLALTPLGRFAKRLLIACVALEIGMAAVHAIVGMDALAEHMRVMYRQGDGAEGMLAQVTGNLAWGVQFAAMLGIVLMIVDRRSRRLAAERAAEADAAKEAGAGRGSGPRPAGKR